MIIFAVQTLKTTEMEKSVFQQQVEAAISGALVTRGSNKGSLKAKCPPVDTPEAAAWQAIMGHANPYKVGFGHLMFMGKENRAIYNAIDETIKSKGLDVRALDRDRKVLDLTLNIW